MRSHARVVVIGGGVMGVGLLYHLAKEGWADVVLVEKGELTSGSTWHAAGLVPHFIGSLNLAKVHFYGSQLYQRLEEEVGQATGWHGCGAIRLATNRDEVDWFRYVQGVLRCVGAECHLIGPAEIAELHPLLDTEGVLLGAYTPGDGHTDPASSTMAMAAGARAGGAEIYLRNRVVDIARRRDGTWDVVTEQGTIVAEHVVNAAGGFAPQVGAMVGLDVPIVNMVHQYLVTEDLDEVAALEREPPVVRDPRASCYYRQEQRGLIVGPYETDGAQALGARRDRLVLRRRAAAARYRPPDAVAGAGGQTHTRLRERRDQAGRQRAHHPHAGWRVSHRPAAGHAEFLDVLRRRHRHHPGAGRGKIPRAVDGPRPDRNQRARDGDPAVRRLVDGKRLQPVQGGGRVSPDVPGALSRRVPRGGRPVRTTPIHDKLATRGAVFAETFGWERAKWFAPPGVEERYGFRRMNWFDAVGEECRAVREGVGVLDLSAFAKFDVAGADAARFLDRIVANRVPREGRIVLAHALTELGGIESEFTVTRLDENRFYLLSASVAQIHDRDWLVQHRRASEDVEITDVTDDYGVLAVAGPRSRELLAEADRRRSRQRGFSLAVGARDRGRGRAGQGAPGVLCGRARLGAPPPDGPHGRALRRHNGGGRGIRRQGFRPLRHELPPHGEGATRPGVWS